MSKKLDDAASSIVKTVAVDVVSLASYKSQAHELADFLTNTPCKTAEAEAWFSAQLSTVRALLKRLEDERTARTRPILAAKRSVDGLFTPATNPLRECEDIIRGKLAGAALGRLERERAALQLAQEAAASGDTDQVMAALAEVPEAVATVGSSVTYTWVPTAASVNEMVAAGLTQHLLPDMASLAAVGKAHKGDEPPVVTGVHFERVAKVRAK